MNELNWRHCQDSNLDQSVFLHSQTRSELHASFGINQIEQQQKAFFQQARLTENIPRLDTAAPERKFSYFRLCVSYLQ
ncbi:MAG: hypothetical protein HYR68_04400 [Burkholderiales bacterium]|nr:hypothetical protein [Burkholderiales bacterium]MBI3731755.1 hypothetical protein [Burkholderiales bacterium]